MASAILPIHIQHKAQTLSRTRIFMKQKSIIGTLPHQSIIHSIGVRELDKEEVFDGTLELVIHDNVIRIKSVLTD